MPRNGINGINQYRYRNDTANTGISVSHPRVNTDTGWGDSPLETGEERQPASASLDALITDSEKRFGSRQLPEDVIEALANALADAITADVLGADTGESPRGHHRNSRSEAA